MLKDAQKSENPVVQLLHHRTNLDCDKLLPAYTATRSLLECVVLQFWKHTPVTTTKDKDEYFDIQQPYLRSRAPLS